MRDFDQVVAFVEVLCINDMNFKLGVASNVGQGIYELVLILLSFFQSHDDFFLLASVVNHLAHDFLFPLDQLLARVDVRLDELLSTIAS